MAITQAQLDAILDYSWADIAKMAKKAMLDLTISEETTMMGHHIRKADMKSLMLLYDTATAQASSEEQAWIGGDVALVQIGQRV